MSGGRVRPAAVAGLFYPRDPGALAAAVDRYIADGDDGEAVIATAAAPVAVIVPHAGYVYSGPVAGSVYARLAPYRDTITRVVLIGPAHRARVDGIATVGIDALATPLGLVPVDVDLRAELLEQAAVHVDDPAHAQEHCLEVQLPFLQRTLGAVTVVPLLAGLVAPEVVAATLDAVWGRPGLLVVVSSDLSHYHDIGAARRLDARTAAAIVAGHEEVISWEDACGATAVRASLLVAATRGQHATLVDLRTSGDTAGSPERVVGYGGFEIR